MSQDLSKLISEDIEVLLETLSNFQQMETNGIDSLNTIFLRRERNHFIKQTQRDITTMLKLLSIYENKTV